MISNWKDTTTTLSSRHSTFLMFCSNSPPTCSARSSVLVGTSQRLPSVSASSLFVCPLHTTFPTPPQFASCWEYSNLECCQELLTTCRVGIAEASSLSACPSTLSQLHWPALLAVFTHLGY